MILNLQAENVKVEVLEKDKTIFSYSVGQYEVMADVDALIDSFQSLIMKVLELQQPPNFDPPNPDTFELRRRANDAMKGNGDAQSEA